MNWQIYLRIKSRMKKETGLLDDGQWFMQPKSKPSSPSASKSEESQVLVGVIGTPRGSLKPQAVFGVSDSGPFGKYEPRSKKDLRYLKDQLKRNEHLLSSHQSQMGKEAIDEWQLKIDPN